MNLKIKPSASHPIRIAIAVALITIIAALLEKHGPSALTVLFVLIGTLPAAYAIWLVVRNIRQQDELYQQIQREAVTFAFVGTLIVTYAYGALEDVAHAPQLSWTYIFPIMTAMWLVSLYVAQRRYQ